MNASMKRGSWLLLALTSIFLIVGYFGSRAWWMNKCAGWLAASSAVPVRIERATRGTMAYVLQAKGELRPVKEANVVARVSGTVKEIHYQVGDSVSEGAVVAVLEPTESLQRMATLETNLAAARSQLAEKDRQFVDAEQQLARTQELLNQDLIAKRELDPAQVAADTARAQLELAKAQVAQQDAMLAQSRKLLGLTRLTAPFSGVVTDRMVEPGSEVGDSTAILTIASMDILKVTIRIPEDDLSLAQKGVTVQIRMDESPADVLYGKLARLNSQLGSSGTVAELHVPNRNYDLKPGATVSVSLSSDSKEDVLFVPVAAVMATGERDYVYTVVNGRAQRKDVLRGWGKKNGKVAIKSGLGEEEWVVVDGQQSLTPDSRVHLLGRHEAEQTSQTWASLFCFSNRGNGS